MFSRGHSQPPAPSQTPAHAGPDQEPPRTLAELNATYTEPPAGQNAAVFYARGFDAMHVPKRGTSNLPLLGKGHLPSPGTRLPAALKEELATLWQSNRDALDCFAQAARHERCRYPVDLNEGYDALFAHYPKLDRAVALIGLAALFHADADQGTQATSDVLNCLSLAHSLTDEPALLSQLLRVAGVATAVAALEQTLNRTTLPEANSVALEQFRSAHGGQYPGALSELTPGYLESTPADPFDGQPLRYRNQPGQGYVLHSIGPDLKDDSGDPAHGKDGDIVFGVVKTGR